MLEKQTCWFAWRIVRIPWLLVSCIKRKEWENEEEKRKVEKGDGEFPIYLLVPTTMSTRLSLLINSASTTPYFLVSLLCGLLLFLCWSGWILEMHGKQASRPTWIISPLARLHWRVVLVKALGYIYPVWKTRRHCWRSKVVVFVYILDSSFLPLWD